MSIKRYDIGLVNALSGRKWPGSGPVTSPIWTSPIRTESVTPYLPLLDLYLLGYRGQKCRLHALTIQRCKIFIPLHSVTISELQLTTTDVHHLPGTADTVVSSYRYVAAASATRSRVVADLQLCSQTVQVSTSCPTCPTPHFL